MYLKRWGRPRQIRTDASKLFAGEPGHAARKSDGSSQVRRALAELDIRWAPAESPRDLGGAAPFFDAVRTNLIAQIESMPSKNAESLAAFLEWVFLPRWESKILPPPDPDLHLLLLPEHDLESALATVHFRTVSREGTVRLDRRLYRLRDRAADMASSSASFPSIEPESGRPRELRCGLPRPLLNLAVSLLKLRRLARSESLAKRTPRGCGVLRQAGSADLALL